jgi:hypothetical protein
VSPPIHDLVISPPPGKSALRREIAEAHLEFHAIARSETVPKRDVGVRSTDVSLLILSLNQ